MIHVEQIKSAASGRWRDILPAVASIDADLLDGSHHPCPKCGGTDRFRLLDADAGACICNQCFRERNGDGIAATMWATGWTFPEALKHIGGFLGVNGTNGNGRADVVADVASRKRVSVESLRAFGARADKRGNLSVCRIPMFNESGAECSCFDIATIDDKWLKGLAAKGKPAGLFLADGKLPATGSTVLVVEGVKDAAALHSLGFVAVGLPTKEMHVRFARALADCHVVIVPDRDSDGERGAQKTAARLAGVAASVRVATLPGELRDKGGGDVRDVLSRPDGERMLRSAIDDAREWEPEAQDRARIEVTPDEHVVIDQTITALARDAIYKRAGVLVHVVREKTDTDDDGIRRTAGTPRIREVSPGLLRERLAACCYFYKLKETENGAQELHVPPPGFAVQSIHTRGFWEPLRLLTGIVETPVLRRDGTILDAPGWDEQTGLLYEPGDVVPCVPENPDRAEALTARDMLLDLVADFPFAAETHRSSWLAALLTVLARRAFSGPAPKFLIDANVRGSGKSLLTDVIAIITTGRDMPRLSNPGDDDEARKRITSLAIAGDPLVLIDNIGSTLGSASLDAALTSTVWKDRLLSTNRVVECALRAVWFATGNNIILKADTSRRVCHVRLESPEESPEERTGFKYPNLLRHVRGERLALLTAGLTILRAFVVAGCPDAGLKPWGSFEGWSSLVRNCIAWLGLPDPGETRRELAEASDRDAAALRSLFAGWSEVDPEGDGLTAAALVKLLDANPDRFATVRDALAELCDSSKGLTARRVGNQLRRFRGRVIGNQRLDYRDGRGRQRLWKVESIRSGDTGDSGDSVFQPLAREVGTPIQGDGRPEGNLSEPERVSPESPQSPQRTRCGMCGGRLESEICPSCADWS